MGRSLSWRLGCTAALLGLVLMPFRRDAPAGSSSFAAEETPVLIPHPMTVLLHAATVYDELGLDGARRAALATAVNEVDLPLWRLRDLPPAERNRSASSLLDTLHAQLAVALTPRQGERFDQLVLQVSGLPALLEPRLAAALALAPDQRQRIQAALARMVRPAASADRLRAETERTVMSILSEGQRRTWAGLLGPRFDFTAVRAVACRAPELEGVTAWLNSPPLRLEHLRGKVVVVHFYTWGCINCIRNLPHYNDWHTRFDPNQLTLVGIHRPETPGERDLEKVRQKAAAAGIRYPVAVDNESRNWDAWANRVWPSVYLLDRRGFVRYWWYGELNWQGAPGAKWMRDRVAELLAEPQHSTSEAPAAER
ncbi:MAG: redoxin domain-containing protein [Planctomycetes bacterium]|jgi:thiol-disulfide isomerase/thioredoxin|nr:redoxin domain-containing protein [Planctomycetota bacterium]